MEYSMSGGTSFSVPAVESSDWVAASCQVNTVCRLGDHWQARGLVDIQHSIDITPCW